jgi:hypothetical protein
MAVAMRDPQGCRERAEKALGLYRTKYTRDAVLPEFVDFFATIIASGKR